MITDQDLKKLEHLAKITINDQDKESFRQKLSSVIEMIDKLHELDCSNVEPLRSVCDMQQRLREDEVTIGDISDDLFENIPGTDASFAKEVKCFIVPKVIE